MSLDHKTNDSVLKKVDLEYIIPTSGMNNDIFLDQFSCGICRKVAIDPVECSNFACAKLYCEKCIASLNNSKQCPNRCGSNTYQSPNSGILKQLHGLLFKCQNHPGCSQIFPYHSIQKHNSECKSGSKKCENQDCMVFRKKHDIMVIKHRKEK